MLVRIRAILRGEPGRRGQLNLGPRERSWSDSDDFAEAGPRCHSVALAQLNQHHITI